MVAKRKKQVTNEILKLVQNEYITQFFSNGRGGRGDALKKQACELVFSQSREQLVCGLPDQGSNLGSIPFKNKY